MFHFPPDHFHSSHHWRDTSSSFSPCTDTGWWRWCTAAIICSELGENISKNWQTFLFKSCSCFYYLYLRWARSCPPEMKLVDLQQQCSRNIHWWICQIEQTGELDMFQCPIPLFETGEMCGYHTCQYLPVWSHQFVFLCCSRTWSVCLDPKNDNVFIFVQILFLVYCLWPLIMQFVYLQS